ncbi:MAG TPA: pimeloyl-ACP methyl ester esterase BioH [Casimicrobiaceae bacterium]|nr:pimeloyl-ACP methyl ester esterase BioH [Casimicrobiaceae bacterium]
MKRSPTLAPLAAPGGLVSRSGRPFPTDTQTLAARVHVESAGFGTPLVLLHGFAMHGGLFAPLLASLARAHRVHVVDLPGHGRSAPIARVDLTALANAVDAAIGVDTPVCVLGWSLGGQVALQWALTHPGRVTRLVLVATTPSFVQREDWPHARSVEALARFGDELRVSYRLTLQRFLSLQVQGSEEGRATLAELRERLFERGEPSPATLAGVLALLRHVDLRPALARVTVPALVVAGDRDTLVPLEATLELAAALPKATHVTIAGAAHAPFLSHRTAFLDAISPFTDG